MDLGIDEIIPIKNLSVSLHEEYFPPISTHPLHYPPNPPSIPFPPALSPPPIPFPHHLAALRISA